MVSDKEIADCVDSLLRQRNSDGSAVSANVHGVLQQAEAKLGLDLSHKQGFIRDRIDSVLRSQNESLRQSQFYSIPPYAPIPAQNDLIYQLQQPEGHGSPEGSSPKPEKSSADGKSKRRRGPGGLTKLCGVSPLLQTIVGESTLPRTEIVKQLWAYIRKNNLQDPNNKRKIICNDELRVVFETDHTDIFMMNKLLAKHIVPLEPSKVPARSKKKMKVKEDEEGDFPVTLSDELVKFFGTGEREMLKSEAFKRITDYINVYNLKDSTNSKMIRCDAKLQRLFGCELIPDQGVFKMLSRHLFKKS